MEYSEWLKTAAMAAVTVHVFDVPGFARHNARLGWLRLGVYHVEVEAFGWHYAFGAAGPAGADGWQAGVVTESTQLRRI